MVRLVIVFIAFVSAVSAQSIAEVRDRFERHFNFRGQLSGLVRFDSNAVVFYDKGKKTLAIYRDEFGPVALYLKTAPADSAIRFLQRKGLSRLLPASRDSVPVKPRTLTGLRIALDPGHFGINDTTAKAEQKYLSFTDSTGGLADTIRLYESSLTFATASILAAMLRDRGAEVMLTRDAPGHTSFNCTYEEWLRRHRQRTIDSLLTIKMLTIADYAKLKKADAGLFFREFFRDFDLAHRALLINAFGPDATVVIHYNVDEKNAPWKKVTNKNFTMAFIPGAFGPKDLARAESLVHFIRWLLSPDFEASQQLSALTVNAFHTQLEVPIAKAGDATYLRDRCMEGGYPGVFCRNLVMCRNIKSPLVYGESLYQDNVSECRGLMRCDTDLYGVKTSERVGKVAKCYFEALEGFFGTE